MFEVLDELDGQGLADALDANHRADLGRQALELMLVCGWADVHNEDSVPTDPSGRVLSGMERAKRYGADGTPLVAEFATAELAPLLGRSPGAADNLLRDGLDLRHRHPQLWERVAETAKLAATPPPALTGQLVEHPDPTTELGLEEIEPVQVWQARKVAQACHDAELSLEQARWVDEVTTPLLGKLPWARFERTLAAAIVEVDPGAAEARARAEALRQHVALGQSTEHGLITMIIKAQAGDMITAKAMIDRLADILALEGDTRPVNIRQATAAGILMGNPYRAVTLLLTYATDSGDHTDDSADADDSGDTARERDGDRETGGDRSAPVRRGSATATVPHTLTDLDGLRDLDHREVVLFPDSWPERAPQDLPDDDPAVNDDAHQPHGDQVRPEAPHPEAGDPWAGLPPPDRGDLLSTWDLHPSVNDADDSCSTCHGTGRAPTDPAGSTGLPSEAELLAALADAVRSGKIRPEKLHPPATLYVHLSAHALWHALAPEAEAPACPHCAAGEPVPATARVEGHIGPALRDQVRRWLQHHYVTVRPVIDLNTNHAVDCYEVPAWMAEALHLAHPASIFPYSPNTSSGKDSDHTVAFATDEDGSPAEPEQTRIDNLGGLERRLHRVKTFGRGWVLHQPERGVYLWRSPHGYWYRVDNTGTHRLGKHPDLSGYGTLGRDDDDDQR